MILAAIVIVIMIGLLAVNITAGQANVEQDKQIKKAKQQNAGLMMIVLILFVAAFIVATFTSF